MTTGVIPLGSFEKTIAKAVSTTHTEHICVGPYTNFVVTSDRNVHVARNRNASVTEFKLNAGDYAKIHLGAGEWLSIVLADGESDGTCYLTEVS